MMATRRGPRACAAVLYSWREETKGTRTAEDAGCAMAGRTRAALMLAVFWDTAPAWLKRAGIFVICRAQLAQT